MSTPHEQIVSLTAEVAALRAANDQLNYFRTERNDMVVRLKKLEDENAALNMTVIALRTTKADEINVGLLSDSLARARAEFSEAVAVATRLKEERERTMEMFVASCRANKELATLAVDLLLREKGVTP